MQGLPRTLRLGASHQSKAAARRWTSSVVDAGSAGVGRWLRNDACLAIAGADIRRVHTGMWRVYIIKKSSSEQIR